MNNPVLFDQIIAKLRTTEEAAELIHSLEVFSNASFSPKEMLSRQQIFRKLPSGIAAILISHFGKASPTPEEQITIKREVNELLDQLRVCKSIKMTIAFQPDDATISFFSDWVKKNVRQDLLLDLHYDKSIVAGTQIIFGGIYKDYSIKKKLTDRFQIQREEIIKLLE